MGQEIRKISKSDESCISNPKLEISNWTVQSKISNFGLEMQDSSDIEISDAFPAGAWHQ
jgi:hypothetical protein